MALFNPEKLTVDYRDGVTAIAPVIPRLYTLTHSDTTGQLFLTIGSRFAWDLLTPMRDEVLGEWRSDGVSLNYHVYLHIDEGQFTYPVAEKRNEIFRRELPLAFTAIRYGDRLLFDTYPILDHAPIIVHFMSLYPQLATQENWGCFCNYSLYIKGW